MNDQDAVQLLRDLLAVYSPSGQETALGKRLAKRMAALGFVVEVDEVGNVIGTLDSGGTVSPSSPALLFLGHIDTVPGLVPVRVEGGKVYGRGVVDAKGPLAAFVVAASRVATQIEDAHIVVVGAVGEEADGIGARHIVNRFRPSTAIVGEPSGWNGITLGYKGRLVVHYSLFTPVTHTAFPTPSALEKALEFWLRLLSYSRRYNRRKGRFFDRLDVSLRHIGSSSDGLREHVEMAVLVRLPPSVDMARLEKNMTAWADGQRVGDDTMSLRFGGEEEAFVAPKSAPLVPALLKAIRAAGGSPHFKLKTGTSDMNVVGPVWRCPIAAYGPGDSSLDHTPYEHMVIEEYLRSIRVLEQVCWEVAGKVSANR